MRKGILLIFTMLATLIGCGQYDDSELKSDINDLKSRMAALEKQCKNMNENLTSLQAIVDAIQKQDGIVSVTDLPDGQGYSVKFVSGKVIYMYNGKNGTDGVTPKISVRKDSDGIYYWTVDGDWLIVDGKKVRAVGLDGKDGKDGKDAVTPQLKIVDGFWYISYDNGKYWTKLGKATGENGKDGQDGNDGDVFFKSVTVEDGYAVFVMNDSEQTTLRIPIAGVSAVSSIKYVPETPDGVVKIRYSKIDYWYVAEDFVIKFEIMPQSFVDYIMKNWKEVLVAKAITYIGEFVSVNIKNVVCDKDNIIAVTIDGQSLGSFLSTGVSVTANLRLSVKINGSESISSDYLPLSPSLLYDYIIEYTSVYDEAIGRYFQINGSSGSFVDSYTGNTGRITFKDYHSPGEKSLFSCVFHCPPYSGPIQHSDLESLNFVTPIELSFLSFKECDRMIKADLSNVRTENVTDMKEMFSGCEDLAKLDLSSFDTGNVTDMSNMFSGCNALASLDLTSFDTGNVTNMSNMFSGCNALASLDLTSFDTKNVTNMCGMFRVDYHQNSSLASLDLSSFDTKNVTDMGQMFYRCDNLRSLDLSSFDTKNVTNMREMFYRCHVLTSLDLSSFDTKNVTNMREMFYRCDNLTSLDLSSFDTKNVTDMEAMFYGCESLASLDLTSFDTRRVTNMGQMFSYCKSLISLDLSGFDTTSAMYMGSMFKGCKSLTSLDLSGFDMRRVGGGSVSVPDEDRYLSWMFDGCDNLKEIIMRGCDKKTIDMISNVKPKGAVIITD
jgi:surface protein